MKKILVPIDYSSHSDNAVVYALEMAKKIHADIHLFHGIETPEFVAMPGFMVWPSEDFTDLKAEADNDMEKYVTNIRRNPSFQYPYLRNIGFSTAIGSTNLVIGQAILDQKPDLVVMGMEDKRRINRFFLGSTSRAMIEKATVPILLIPAKARYRPIEKIAFATDLSENDLNSIHDLTRLFSLYNPEILLVHVDDQLSDFHDPRTPSNQFLNRVTCNINYNKIYYRHISETDIGKGLKWLTENGQVDILSMIHRHPSIFSRILDGSYTQKLAKSIHLPLLVMPEDKTPIGW